MKRRVAKILSMVLSTAMIFTSMSMNALAAQSKKEFSESQLSLVSDKTSTLAPGVTQDIYTVYDKNGAQVKMFAATMDMSVDSVKLYASYQNMDNNTYGMSKLTEQVKAFNEKAANGDQYYQGTVVAGINASYYNMTTGKPTGVFVMNGNDVTDSDKSAGYFAVMKDGTVKIGKPAEYDSDKGNIQEAIGIYKMLVYDGQIALSTSDQNNAQKYPRQTIGITADNKVIVLTADGNQEPESIGLTLMEQAQVMKDLGCVYAGHLDGGGSATYGSKAEGSDTFSIVNKPSDGSERSISNGLIIVSTEKATNTFDHVKFNVENEYVTPETSISFETLGVSATGNEAEIPQDISYTAQYGKIDNGVYTAPENECEDVINATYNGKNVGTVSIHVVNPDKISFNSEKITVPFGKTVAIGLTANYGINEVKIKESDIKLTLSDSQIGTIEGFNFTAGDGSSTLSTIEASLVKNPDVKASSKIELGKGSEVIYDFEDGDVSDFSLGYGAYNYTLPEGKVYAVNSKTGKVHSGNGAMALDINYGNSLESGYMMTALAYSGGDRTFENAKRLGMWIYIPIENVSTWIRYTVFPMGEGSTITDTMSDGVPSTTGFVNQYQESGWHYLSIDLSKYKGLDLKNNYYMVQFYISDRDGASYDYYYNQHKSYNGRYVMYVDDITVDYSDAVDDREAPIFGDISYATTSMSDAVVLKDNQKVENNKISFSAKVAENTKKSNYSGLNPDTAKAYIDGVEVDNSFKNGIISIPDTELSDGVHHIKFSICDNMGNYSSKIGTIDVESRSKIPTVKVVAHDPSLDKIKLGSVWYADIVATDIEKVQSVDVDIDLNNMSKWELDNMEVAKGFEASYSIQDDENIATITINRVGTNNETGESILASLPIRAWELKTGYTYDSGTMKGKEALTYEKFKNQKEFWPIDISMKIARGLVTYVDGTIGTFSGEGPHVDTEMYKMAKDMISTKEGKEYYDSWNGGHVHTAVALEDKAATCIEAGYTGRTYCEGCNSVVEWGTKIPALGHSYELQDNVLKCKNCGELFNGVWEDGKEYKDGIVLRDGWTESGCYYKDGVKITGIQKVTAPDNSGEFYYDFGRDGICADQSKYTGLLQQDNNWYYSRNGELVGGWIQINDNWHYFRSYTKAAATGEYKVGDVTYQFDEQGMTKGTWYKTDEGTRYYYGPSYYAARNPEYMRLVEIDGKTYNFDNNGYLTYGIQVLRDSTSFKKYVYEFDTDGAMLQAIKDQGFVTDSKGTIYYINEEGYVPMNAGLIKYEEAYYFVCSSGKIKTSGYQTITESNANGLVEAGTYYFGEDGKMQITTPKDDTTGIVNE
ncbi:phosphodiester glycosidase family protein, partial [Dorea sp. 210702-DFI.3.17]|uniref:phosphodiester glycosidase family protein n=1 Tax=Dorea sp. 210702-DFI.3.17 TaxID=2883208 RepID=UPI001D07A8BC